MSVSIAPSSSIAPGSNRAAATAAGLHYVSPGEPGLSRIRRGATFTYRDGRGRVVRDGAILQRIRALVIPPAWTDVWICARADGHVQATGRDARGRKQHRYHPDWTATRHAAKYDRMITFAQALPAIRRRARADLRKPPLSRDHVLATVVTLLEKTLIRIGNREYARANNSFGLTTLLDQHVRIRGSAVRFRFRAKSGVMQTIDIDDASLARIVGTCRNVPGQALFQYIGEDGRRQSVDSAAVNAYLRELTGRPYTAKNFRTWAATVLAARTVADLPVAGSSAAAKRHIVAAIDTVAARLGNTRAVCRTAYIHPAVFDAYRGGVTIRDAHPGPRQAYVSRDEAAVLALLKGRSRGRQAEKAA